MLHILFFLGLIELPPMILGRSIPTKVIARNKIDFQFSVLGNLREGELLVATCNGSASQMDQFAHFFPDQLEHLKAALDAVGSKTPISLSPAVFVLNSDLKQSESFSLPENWFKVHAVSRDRRWLATSMPAEFLLHDRTTGETRSFSHESWRTYTGSDCFFDKRHRLWCVLPGTGGEDWLTIIESESGSVVHQILFPNGQGYASFQEGPDPESVFVEVACGQDGCDIFLARASEATIDIFPMSLQGRTSVSFAPGGCEFVTGSHEGFEVVVHSFPGCAVLASIPNEKIFIDDDMEGDRVGYKALYLDADHILVDTHWGRLIVIRRSDLKILGTIWPEGYEVENFTKDDAIAFEANGSLLGLVSSRRILVQLTGGELILVEVELDRI